jgi:hypothetical protein
VSYYLENFNGQPLPKGWVPPQHYVRGTSYRPSDCISWSQPLLSERAVQVFSDVAPGCAEYRLFTHIKGKRYFVINVLASDDVLDEDASEVTRASSGEIITVKSYAFRQAPSKPLFKLPGRFDSDILCTESIPAAVVQHGLTGFGFWDPSRPTTKDLFLGKDLNCYPGVVA